MASISSSELVMRARHLVFHIRCFSCAVCNSPLTKGDQFGMRDSTVFCRHHYECQLTTTASTEAAAEHRGIMIGITGGGGGAGIGLSGGISAVGTPLNMSCQYTTTVTAPTFNASPNGSACGGGNGGAPPLPAPSTSPGSSEASSKAGGAGNNSSSAGPRNSVPGGPGNNAPPGSNNGAVGSNSGSNGGNNTANSSANSGMLGGGGGGGGGGLGGPGSSGQIGPVPMGFFGPSTPHHAGMTAGLPQAPRQKGRPRKRKPKDIEAMTSNLGESSLRSNDILLLRNVQ